MIWILSPKNQAKNRQLQQQQYLNSKKINSETLLVLFKSLIVQKLLERGCKGTILTAISKDELQKIIDEANRNLEAVFEKKQKEVMG